MKANLFTDNICGNTEVNGTQGLLSAHVYDLQYICALHIYCPGKVCISKLQMYHDNFGYNKVKNSVIHQTCTAT